MIRLLQGDNVATMRTLDRAFALAYLDGPFFTGQVHRMPDGEEAFDDRWEHLTAFVLRTCQTAIEAWSLLAPGGSLVVHLDPKTSHHVKVALDLTLGRAHFASELVWRYRRWPTKTQNFQRVHDVLLRWVKPGAPPRWNQLYEPLSPKTVEAWGTRKQRAVWDPESGKADKPSPRRRRSSSSTAEQSPGAPLGDVWDIGILAPMSKERTGYPTQKPEYLLERLVEATTAPGDWVLDPYVGSGTTLAVCARLERHAVGIDSSPVAIRVATERLAALAGRLFDAVAGGAP